MLRELGDWRPTPIEQWRKFELEARGFDSSLWFLAWDGDEVAAVCLSFPERVGLGVDAESPTGATRLYERVGMRVAVRSDSWDKQL